MRALGHRLPCRICGADRSGQKQNGSTVAICDACYPEYIREYVKSRTVPLYLGAKLKARVEEAARLRGASISEYVRGILKSELDGTNG